jgi:hypothetical protein
MAIAVVLLWFGGTGIRYAMTTSPTLDFREDLSGAIGVTLIGVVLMAACGKWLRDLIRVTTK